MADDVFPGNEVHLYMWPDSTLRDVAESLRVEVITALTSTSFSALNSKLDMAVVFMSQRAGNVVMRDIACVSLEKSGEKGSSSEKSESVLEKLSDASKTLDQLGVRPGDVVDVAVLSEGQTRSENGNRADGNAHTSRNTARQHPSTFMGGRGRGRRGGKGHGRETRQVFGGDREGRGPHASNGNEQKRQRRS